MGKMGTVGTSQGTLLHIGEASKQTGVSPKMIRHYEEMALLRDKVPLLLGE